MKKFLLSVAMFMAGMGAWAQETTTVTEEEMNALLAKTQEAYATYMWGPMLGQPIPVGFPKADAQVTQTLLTAIGNANENQTSKEFYDALDAATEAFLNEEEQIIMPEDGKAYEFSAQWIGRHLPVVWDNNSKKYYPQGASVGTVFVCKEINGQFIFVSDNGYYFGWEAEGQDGYTKNTYDENQKFTLEKAKYGDEEVVSKDLLLGKFCLKANNGHYLMYDFNASAYYSAQDAGTKEYVTDGRTPFFTLTEVDYTTNQFTITEEAVLGETHAGTFYTPYAVEIPEGYTAYTANSVDGTTVNLVKLTGDIPANTAVVITGEPCENKTVSLSTTNPKAITGNKLFGYTAQTAVNETEYSEKTGESGTVYALAKGDTDVEFRHYTGTNFLAGKAYLNAADAAGARSLIFNFGGDTETAIESIEGAEGAADAVVYDLAGRRVQGAQKGLYIVNGKKVIK